MADIRTIKEPSSLKIEGSIPTIPAITEVPHVLQFQPNQQVQTGSDKKLSFGRSFQVRVAAAFLRLPNILPDYMDVVKPKFFDDAGVQTIIKLMYDYYTKYKRTPTTETLADLTKDYCRRLELTDIQRIAFGNLVQEMCDIDLENINYILDKVLDFARLHVAREVALTLVDKMSELESRGEANFDEVSPLIRKLASIGAPGEAGYDVSENIDELPLQLSANSIYSSGAKVPTGMMHLDHILDGGMAAGEIAFFCAPPGAGKSTFLVNVMAAAILSGVNVVCYTMELKVHDYALRLAQRMLGVGKDHVINQSLRYQSRLKEYKELMADRKVVVKYYPPGVATVDTLRNHFSTVIAQQDDEHRNDRWLIVVDYVEKLRMGGNKNSQSWELIGTTVNELIAFGHEFNAPLWTASQINRTGFKKVNNSDGKAHLTKDDVAASWSKVEAADLVLMYSQSEQEKAVGAARIHVAKARRGRDGMSFTVADLRPIMNLIELTSTGDRVNDYDPTRRGQSHIQLRPDWDNETPFPDETETFIMPPDMEIKKFWQELLYGLEAEQHGVDMEGEKIKKGITEPSATKLHLREVMDKLGSDAYKGVLSDGEDS